jgi:hypothetical protein
MENRNTKREYLAEKLILATEATQNMGNDADLWSRNCKSLPYSLLTSKIPHKELPGVAACNGKVKDANWNRQVLF